MRGVGGILLRTCKIVDNDRSFCSCRKRLWRMRLRGTMGIRQADVGWGEKETAVGETLGGEGGKWGLWSGLCLLVMSVEQRSGGVGSQGIEVCMAVTPESKRDVWESRKEVRLLRGLHRLRKG